MDSAVSGTGEADRGRTPHRRWPVHKSSMGGWSQLGHERSAEETWEENAKDLAAGVIDSARRINPEHIVVAGDTRARSLMLDHLTTPLQSRTVMVDEEVRADSPAMASALEHSITALAERECRTRFGEWQARRGHSGTVEGLARRSHERVALLVLRTARLLPATRDQRIRDTDLRNA